MNKNKIIGLILLTVLALAILGGIFNGTYANLGGKNIGYYIGYFGVLTLLLVLGITNLLKKTK